MAQGAAAAEAHEVHVGVDWVKYGHLTHLTTANLGNKEWNVRTILAHLLFRSARRHLQGALQQREFDFWVSKPTGYLPGGAFQQYGGIAPGTAR